jgi:hypothetical protein
VWVGAVERFDGKNPTVKVGHVGMPPYDEEGLAGHALGLSVSGDIQALSESFTSRLSNADRILK